MVGKYGCLRWVGKLSLFPLLAIVVGLTFYNILTSSKTTLNKYDRTKYSVQEHRPFSKVPRYTSRDSIPTEKRTEASAGHDGGLFEIRELLQRFGEQLSMHNELLNLKLSLNDSGTTNSENTTSSPPQRMPLLDFSLKSLAERRELQSVPASWNNAIISNYALARPPFTIDPYYRKSNCPKTIASIAKFSSWFKHRYKPWVKLFVDDDDIDNVENYKNLSQHHLPNGLGDMIREDLQRIMKNPKFTNIPVNRPQRCRRCAAVGNGGILNGSNAGPEIDSHDLVFRLNRVLTDDHFAQDIGTKTSFYVFYPESQYVYSLIDSNAVFLFASFKSSDFNYFEHMITGNTPYTVKTSKGNVTRNTPRIDPSRIKIIHPDMFRYITTSFSESHHRPTTGAVLAFTALHLCDEVNMYGFGYDPRFTMHYYDTKFVKHTNISTGCHDVHEERILWKKLHDEGVVRLFKRDM